MTIDNRNALPQSSTSDSTPPSDENIESQPEDNTPPPIGISNKFLIAGALVLIWWIADVISGFLWNCDFALIIVALFYYPILILCCSILSLWGLLDPLQFKKTKFLNFVLAFFVYSLNEFPPYDLVGLWSIGLMKSILVTLVYISIFCYKPKYLRFLFGVFMVFALLVGLIIVFCLLS